MLSEGRLLPAFGIGSPLAPEWQALGVDTKTRGRGDDDEAILVQTRLLIDQVLPRAEARWPKRPKVTATEK